jgi:hypothetical protein
VPESLDGGKLGPERKLYCREIIARFAHNLALNWNIGEENTQTTEEINDMINYIRAHDPYQHHVVIHTFLVSRTRFIRRCWATNRSSPEHHCRTAGQTHQRTLKWVAASAEAGKPWVVANDEQGSAATGVPPDRATKGMTKKTARANPSTRRRHPEGHALGQSHGGRRGRGVLLRLSTAGERSRMRGLSQSGSFLGLLPHRVGVLHGQQDSLWEMRNANALIGNVANDNLKYALAKPGELYVVFLANGGTSDLDLSGAKGSFSVKWFNPRVGGKLSNGSVRTVRECSHFQRGPYGPRFFYLPRFPTKNQKSK